MLRQLGSICCIAVLVSLSAAESPGAACSKEGDVLGMRTSCKEYLICEKGHYVIKSCGFWQQFDIKLNECRWSPLATCRQNKADATVLAYGTEMKCSSNGACTSKRESVSVIGECQYYCVCKDGQFKNPKKCLLDAYYDPIRKTCTPDSSVCQNIPEPSTDSPLVPSSDSPPEPSTDTTPAPTLPPISNCDKNGEKIADKDDCHKYFQCTISQDKKTYQWKPETCLPTRYFDKEKNDCAFNIIINSTIPWVHIPC